MYWGETHDFERELEFDRKRDHFVLASFELTVFFGSFGRVLFGFWICGKKMDGLFGDSFFSDHFVPRLKGRNFFVKIRFIKNWILFIEIREIRLLISCDKIQSGYILNKRLTFHKFKRFWIHPFSPFSKKKSPCFQSFERFSVSNFLSENRRLCLIKNN